MARPSQTPLLHRKPLTCMSHEPKSASLGMISTATRNTATVSPLTPNALNGSVVANGNAAPQSAHSGFAAALRKLAKQAEEPRGPSSISSESSPVSSPATNHSSPVSTPKRGPVGPVMVPPGGHSVPSTPPVVTIAPTKTVNGLWRSEGRQVRVSCPVANRDSAPQQEKGVHALPPHLMGSPFALGLPSSTAMPDPRLQALNLQRQLPHMVAVGGVGEEYLRGFRPYTGSEDLRVPPLSLGLDPSAAAVAAAYFHSGYLPHPSLGAYRLDEALCLSALRSPFYQPPAGGALSLHPSALHLPLPGVRYPGDLTHPSLTALQAERLQMEDELRQRERERERERERDRERVREKERERERELEREREKEREREREREVDRQKERCREKEIQAVKALERHYLNEMHSLRPPPEDRAKLAERLDKPKESHNLPTPKPLQPSHYPLGSPLHPVPPHGGHYGPGTGGIPGGLAGPVMLRHGGEEERWLSRQRRHLKEKEERQGQVSDFRQQVLEQQLELSRPGDGGETREGQRPSSKHHEGGNRDLPLHLGAPPPLISPKSHQRDHPVPANRDHPAPPPTTLWSPACHINSSSESRRSCKPPTPPTRPPPGLSKSDRAEELSRPREFQERFPPRRGHSILEHGMFLAELEKSAQTLLNQQRVSLSVPSQYGDQKRVPSPSRSLQGPSRTGPDPMLLYDEVLQQHRKLVSKLDLEAKRKREAREKGYYYDLDDSYDESDEEEVKAHLRRVSEQPPLKLDESTEKLAFLSVVGLTTLSKRDAVLQQKRRKRRRMLRERSRSPPVLPAKRQAPAPPPLATHFTAEEMDLTPELEDKKRFLNAFNLSHVSQQQRRENKKVMELLEAIKQKTVTLDTLRHNTHTPCSSPPVLAVDSTQSSPSHTNGTQHSNSPSPTSSNNPIRPSDVTKHTDPHRPQSEAVRAKEPPPLAPLPDKARASEGFYCKKPPLHPKASLPHPKDAPPSLNGRPRPWESFSAELFAQHFHQSVLQSTQRSLEKHKDGAPGVSEPNHKLDSSVHYNAPDLQGPPNRVPHPQTNGHSLLPAPGRDPSRAQEEQSGEDSEEEEEDDEDEDVSPAPRWKGIEGIFHMYHEYMEERCIEQQVLQSQCRRLEAQHYSLSVTAEQLSHKLGELLAQKQRLAMDRERMQNELEGFRKSLTLPQTLWARGHYRGFPPR
uniref:Genetic suppressor element-like domain-containing protein n=1 Tax=Denticeps clupeoides TaxID=299321 RepID=A0AAY4B4J9_9TELE